MGVSVFFNPQNKNISTSRWCLFITMRQSSNLIMSLFDTLTQTKPRHNYWWKTTGGPEVMGERQLGACREKNGKQDNNTKKYVSQFNNLTDELNWHILKKEREENTFIHDTREVDSVIEVRRTLAQHVAEVWDTSAYINFRETLAVLYTNLSQFLNLFKTVCSLWIIILKIRGT